jgi:tRNA threonylcarbamoyladenosine biosynthesis protein TsaB
VIVLAVDTSSATGSLAVARDGSVLAEGVGDPHVPHGRRLPGDVMTLLNRAQVRIGDVDLYAVATGPGAFTGLRIGIAAVQGFAFAHARPVAGISALDAAAYTAYESGSGGRTPFIGVWLDAARQEVFSALYAAASDGRLMCVEEPAVGAPERTLPRWGLRIGVQSVSVVGDGAVRYAALIHAAGLDARVHSLPVPIAGTMTRLALEAHGRGLSGPPHAIRPLYVRRPDAVLARERQGRPPADSA